MSFFFVSSQSNDLNCKRLNLKNAELDQIICEGPCNLRQTLSTFILFIKITCNKYDRISERETEREREREREREEVGGTLLV